MITAGPRGYLLIGALVCMGLTLFLLGQGTGWACEEPLVANIGWNLTSSSGPWNTSGIITVSKGAIIYFRALNASNSPITDNDDQDWAGGQIKQDTAHYTWDWNYSADEGTGNTGTTTGYSASKTYNNPGNRVVRLYVYDSDGAGYTDDANKSDTVTVKVKLTLETDGMAGVQGQCTQAQHSIYPNDLAAAWVEANYTLGIDADHQTNCTHYPYIGDGHDDAWIISYLDGYENQGCDLYLMGGHRYKENTDWAGATWRQGQANALGMTFGLCSGGLNNNEKTSTHLHENASHDGTVGAINHCANDCPCNTLNEVIVFCNDCIAELKAAQNLDN